MWWYNLSDAERDRFQEMADNNNRLREQQNAAAAAPGGSGPSNVTEEDFKVSSNAWGSIQPNNIPNRDGKDMTSTSCYLYDMISLVTLPPVLANLLSLQC